MTRREMVGVSRPRGGEKFVRVGNASNARAGACAFLFLTGLAMSCSQLFGEGGSADPEQMGGSGETPSDREVFAASEQDAGVWDVSAVCTPGQVECAGAELRACADDGSGFLTLQICPSAALCQTEPAGCAPALCEPDEMTCDDERLLRCNPQRTAFDLFDTCESSAHCNSDQRRCSEMPCQSEQIRCNRAQSGEAEVQRCTGGEAGWEPLAACVTRALCAQTLVRNEAERTADSQQEAPLIGGCEPPLCQPGEVVCDGVRLMACNDGQTGYDTVEECATVALCALSLENRNAAGVPQCVPPACEAGAFECTEAGVLQSCQEDRTGFLTVQACIGPSFCDASAGVCNGAPCEPGSSRCNGARLERCREDRTGFDPLGLECESAALCNASAAEPFCEDPACRRGDLSSDEFLCDGSTLSRCQEGLTAYEPSAECATPALCDASARFDGCRPPACEPDELRCRGAFLEGCNAERTAFEPLENCGAASQCDASVGTCTDPCLPGSVRCTPRGELEECVDRLSGWQLVADCLTRELCDAEQLECRPPACTPEQRRCRQQGQGSVLEGCAAGRDGFQTLLTCSAAETCDAPGEQCDACQPGSVRCEGDFLVTCSGDGQVESRTRCEPGLYSDARRRCTTPVRTASCSRPAHPPSR